MGITLLQIDKSGSSFDERNYSIVVAKNKEVAYGVNIPQKLKKEIFQEFRKLGYSNKRSDRKKFLMKFHISVVIFLIQKAIYPYEKVIIEICNDYDGHAQKTIFWHPKNF